MNVILIDTENQTIKSIELKGKLQEYYNLIGNGCNLVEIAHRFENEDVIFVDEEGLFNDHKFGFVIGGNPYIGNGIVVGTTENGESKDCVSTEDEIRNQIFFTSIIRRE